MVLTKRIRRCREEDLVLAGATARTMKPLGVILFSLEGYDKTRCNVTTLSFVLASHLILGLLEG